jgi:hypothetical protein
MLRVGPYRATVVQVAEHRVALMHFSRAGERVAVGHPPGHPPKVGSGRVGRKA